MRNDDFNILGKLKLIFTSPSTFFEKNLRGDSISGSIILFLLVSIIAAFTSFIISAHRSNILFFPTELIHSSILRNSIRQPFLGLACIFVFAFIALLVARMLGGVGGYKHNINVMAYSWIPNAIFSGFPGLPAGIGFGLGAVAFIYSIYLGVIGLAMDHRISRRKALYSYIAPCLIFIVGAILFYIFVFAIRSLF